MPITPDRDVVILGAGFGGLYALIKFRDKLGFNAQILEAMDGIGGTWYVNTYPGALSDSEAHLYRYTFDKEFSLNYPWSRKFVPQKDVLKYLEAVADHYNLRKDIKLNSKVAKMEWDDDNSFWKLTTHQGETITARYVITALGLVNEPNFPKFEGFDSYKGRVVHPARWPKDLGPGALKGKKIGIIGAGSSGSQIISELSKDEEAVGSITSFQRTPQYCVPARDGPVSPEEMAQLNKDYDKNWAQARSSPFGLAFDVPDRSIFDVDEAERKRIFDHAWERGSGFFFMFGTFNDLTINEEANELACQYIRDRIQQTVKDPEKARKLTPHGIHGRRPISENNYYEAFNKDNIDVVLLTEEPLERFTPKGLKTSKKEYEFDLIIVATGFEAVEGNYNKMEIIGKSGKKLKEVWDTNPGGYGGITIADNPNLFMVLGPGGPFSNVPPLIELEIDWIGDLVKAAKGANIVATAKAQQEWMGMCKTISNMLVFSKIESWITGANAGRQGAVLFYLGGTPNFQAQLDGIKEKNWPGLVFWDPATKKVTHGEEEEEAKALVSKA